MKATMTVPNALSIFRIFIAPIVVHLIFRGLYREAFWLIVIAGFTDTIDGFLARRFHSTSEFGTFLDPLADKLLVVFVFSTLSLIGLCPLWLFLTIFGKELILAASWMSFRFIINQETIVPNAFGKSASTFLMLLVLAILAESGGMKAFNFLVYLKPVLLYGSFILIILSLLSYIKFGVKTIGSYQSGEDE